MRENYNKYKTVKKQGVSPYINDPEDYSIFRGFNKFVGTTIGFSVFIIGLILLATGFLYGFGEFLAVSKVYEFYPKRTVSSLDAILRITYNTGGTLKQQTLIDILQLTAVEIDKLPSFLFERSLTNLIIDSGVVLTIGGLLSIFLSITCVSLVDNYLVWDEKVLTKGGLITIIFSIIKPLCVLNLLLLLGGSINKRMKSNREMGGKMESNYT